MRRLLSYALPYTLAAVIAATTFAWLADGAAIIDSAREMTRLGRLSESEYRAERRQARREEKQGGEPSVTVGRPAEDLLSRAPARVSGGISRAWDITTAVLLASLLALSAVALLRLNARGRRRMRRLWLVPGRTDEASPVRVRRLLESWQQQLGRRWWRRLVAGQPSLCLELHAWPERPATEIRLGVSNLAPLRGTDSRTVVASPVGRPARATSTSSAFSRSTSIACMSS